MGTAHKNVNGRKISDREKIFCYSKMGSKTDTRISSSKMTRYQDFFGSRNWRPKTESDTSIRHNMSDDVTESVTL